jgi:hypothetical protein
MPGLDPGIHRDHQFFDFVVLALMDGLPGQARQ